MNKLLNLKLFIAALVLVGFSACKGPNVVEPPQKEWTKVSVTRFVYMGMEEGNHLFLLYMHLEGAIVNNNIVKSTTEWFIPFLSESITEDFKPKFGEYPISFEVAYVPNTFNGSYAYAQDIVLGSALGEELRYQTGKLVVEANKITFEGKRTDDVEYSIVYEGAYSVLNESHNAWAGEPQTPTTKNEEFTQGTLKAISELNDTILLIELNKVNGNDRVDAQIEVFINGNDSVLAAGNYQIADNNNIGTFRASQGLSQFFEIIGCALYYTDTTGGNTSAHEIYYITSGTAVVTQTEMNLHGISHFGSTINIKYTGSFNFTPAR